MGKERTPFNFKKEQEDMQFIEYSNAMFEMRDKESRLLMRERSFRFLLICYGMLLFSTMTIIFFQGFKFLNFNLDPIFLKWLGIATIGEIAGLAGIVYGALFKS